MLICLMLFIMRPCAAYLLSFEPKLVKTTAITIIVGCLGAKLKLFIQPPRRYILLCPHFSWRIITTQSSLHCFAEPYTHLLQSYIRSPHIHYPKHIFVYTFTHLCYIPDFYGRNNNGTPNFK